MDDRIVFAGLALASWLLAWIGLRLGLLVVSRPLPGWRAAGLAAAAGFALPGAVVAAEELRLAPPLPLALLAVVATALLVGLVRLGRLGAGRAIVPWSSMVVGGLVLIALLVGVGGLATPFSQRRPNPQRYTVAMIRNLGTAWMTYLTDHVAGQLEVPGPAQGGVMLASLPATASAAAPTPAPTPEILDPAGMPPVIPHAELEALLVPDYIDEVPELDGWGNPLEVRFDPRDLQAGMVIRSAGSDREMQLEGYVTGPFAPEDHGQDIVWADGFFVRWPETATATPE